MFWSIAELLCKNEVQVMVITGSLSMNESQLFRARDTPTTANRIRNPGCRSAYSYGLACLISMNLLM